jgi:hypothetical protein
VHPGRGLPGTLALLDAASDYLDVVEAAVQAARTPAEAKAAVVKKTPGLRFPVFLDIGLGAVWRTYGKG